MSKNSQSEYYEVGVFSLPLQYIVNDYVTSLHIIKQGRWVHEKLVNLMKNLHGDNTIILWNEKKGALPNDGRDVIDINIPNEPKLMYNR